MWVCLCMNQSILVRKRQLWKMMHSSSSTVFKTWILWSVSCQQGFKRTLGCFSVSMNICLHSGTDIVQISHIEIVKLEMCLSKIYIWLLIGSVRKMSDGKYKVYNSSDLLPTMPSERKTGVNLFFSAMWLHTNRNATMIFTCSNLLSSVCWLNLLIAAKTTFKQIWIA